MTEKQTKLMPIFAKRLEDLKKAHPKYKTPGADKDVVQVSLVAQTFLKENNYKAVDLGNMKLLNEIMKTLGVDRRYRIDADVLISAFADDLAKGIVDKSGNILKPEELVEGSMVMLQRHAGDKTQTEINGDRALRELHEKLQSISKGK